MSLANFFVGFLDIHLIFYECYNYIIECISSLVVDIHNDEGVLRPFIEDVISFICRVDVLIWNFTFIE